MGADDKRLSNIIEAYMAVGAILQDALNDHELENFGDSGKGQFYVLRNHCVSIGQKVAAIYTQYLQIAVERRAATSHHVELVCGVGFPVNGSKDEVREFLNTDAARKMVGDSLDQLKSRPELLMAVKSIEAVMPVDEEESKEEPKEE